MTSSLVPLFIVGGGWYYLSSQGSAMQAIWLALNVLDTFRALRHVRPNGRRIGIVSRRKAMRDALMCWVIYIVVQAAAPIVSTLLSWIPLYSPVSSVLCFFFLFTRLASSTVIYHSLLTPFVKRYETPVDLTFLLFQSLTVLVVHYAIQLPLSVLWTAVKPLTSIIKLIELVSTSTPHSASPTQSLITRKIDEPTVDPDSTIPTSSPSPVPSSLKANPASVMKANPAQHEGMKPPTTAQIVIISPPPSPPPSPPRPHTINAEAGPSTPRRSLEGVSEVIGLKAPEIQAIRRSPRKHTASRSTLLVPEGTPLDIEHLILHPSTSKADDASKITNDPRAKSVNVPARSRSVIDLTGQGRKGKSTVVATSNLSIPDHDKRDKSHATGHTTSSRMRRADTIATIPRTANATSAQSTTTKPLPRRVGALPRSAMQASIIPPLAVPMDVPRNRIISTSSSRTKPLPRSTTQPRTRLTTPKTAVSRIRTTNKLPEEKVGEADAKVGEKRRIIGGDTKRKRVKTATLDDG